EFAYLNDVWVLDLESNVWHSVLCRGEPPEPRYGHACQLVGSRMFVLGGKGPKGKLYRDVYILDMAGGWTWVLVSATSVGPSPRLGSASVLVGRKIVIHGGWDGHGNCCADLWVFDTDSFAWLKPRTAGFPPGPRYGHTLHLLADGRILLFGGAGVASAAAGNDDIPVYLNDLRQLDTETMAWSKPRTGGCVPSARFGHTLTAAGAGADSGGAGGGQVVLLGGWGYGGLQGPDSKRIGAGTAVVLDTNPGAAAELGPDGLQLGFPRVRGRGPLPHLYGHTAAAVGEALYVFGGWSGQQAMGDMFVLELGAASSG
ncbi:unnamed protein product, partial [Phaeothamnion confervicola]